VPAKRRLLVRQRVSLQVLIRGDSAVQCHPHVLPLPQSPPEVVCNI
jgi:hypothetical protein